jgi:hypothetical protein
LFVQTICLLDKQIERAEELPGANPARHFLHAIETHIEAKLPIAGPSVILRPRPASAPVFPVRPRVRALAAALGAFHAVKTNARALVAHSALPP